MVTDAAVRHSPQKRDLVEQLTHRQHLAEVANRINALASADIAHLLEMLPRFQRQTAWEQVGLDKAGDVLWEATDGVADALAWSTSRDRLLAICRHIDDDDLAQIAEHVPADVLQQHYLSQAPDTRAWVKAAVSYPHDSFGHLMNNDEIAVDQGATVKEALKQLRRLGTLPNQTNRLFGRLTVDAVMDYVREEAEDQAPHRSRPRADTAPMSVLRPDDRDALASSTTFVTQ